MAGDRSRVLAGLDGAVVLSVGALVLLHILPHSFQAAGWQVMAPLMVGLLGPTLIERWLERIEKQTHVIVLSLVTFGLSIHALIDGIALSMGGGHAEQSHLLPAAVVLHRVPASLVIWRLLRPGHGRAWAVGALCAVGLATVVGFGAGATWLPELHTPVLGLFEALVAGSLLHVVVHTLQPHRH